MSGDTKVAGKGQVDGVFITTTGMGEIQEGVTVGGELAKPGDAIIVTGDIGRHGCTILLEREDFGIDANVTSDCAPLWGTVKAVMDTTHNLHVIRDATRGGVGTVLYEIAGQSNVGIRLNAAAVPVQPEVKGVCGMLGPGRRCTLPVRADWSLWHRRKRQMPSWKHCINVRIPQMQPSLVKSLQKNRAES
mgnify:CR=1 FL=1